MSRLSAFQGGRVVVSGPTNLRHRRVNPLLAHQTTGVLSMLAIDVPSNNDLASVRQSDDGLGQLNPSTAVEIVRRGQAAMQRLRRGFDDWMAIAEALQIGRAEVMSAVHTNQPTGKRYEKAMADWLLARSFHLIDKGTRNRLLECLKHRADIGSGARR